jgi:RNA polymerase sigma-70 factor, ECF subfamily
MERDANARDIRTVAAATGSIRDPKRISDPPQSSRTRHSEIRALSNSRHGVFPEAEIFHSPTELYLNVQPRVARIARKLLGSSPSREFIHDVSVDAVLSAKSFRGDAAFSSWLYAVVSRHVHKWIRTQSRHRNLMRKFSLRDTPPAAARPDDLTSGYHLYQLVREGLDELSHRQRTCFELVQFEERPVQVVASELGISPSAVRMHVCRARSHLRHWLEPHSEHTDA